MSNTRFGNTKFVVISGTISTVKIVQYTNKNGEPAELLSFSIPVGFNSTKDSNGKWNSETTEWMNVVSPATEFNKKHHRSGSIVTVSGIEERRLYKKQDGTFGTNVEITNASVAIIKKVAPLSGGDNLEEPYDDSAPPNNMGDIPF